MKLLRRMLAVMLKVRPVGFIYAGHGVTHDFVHRDLEEVHIDFASFTGAIEAMGDLGLTFVSMGELVDLAARGFRADKPWCHLTFDDGYANNASVIYPYLKARGIPFSIFVSTHHIETGDRFPTFWLRAAEHLGLDLAGAFPDVPRGQGIAGRIFQMKLRHADYAEHQRVMALVKGLFTPADLGRLDGFANDMPMSLAMLKELAADPLVHIGSHAHEHLIFHQDQSSEVAQDQMHRSWDLIARQWALDPRPTFCYPNGDWAPQWVRLSHRLGYALGFSSHSGFVDSTAQPMMLPRFWLSDARRVTVMAALSLLGNRALAVLGRKPLPRVALTDQ